MEEAALYEFNGKTYESTGEFLMALSHEYQTGNRQLVLDALDKYGFDLSDLNIPGE